MPDVDFVSLAVVGFAGSASPGPNNALLLASGLQFGFRRTTPHVAGAALGAGVLVVVTALGIGRALEASDAAGFALKAGGSAYLLYLAVRLVSSGRLERTDAARPLHAKEAALFQLVNPKAWLFSTTVATAALPEGGPGLLASVVTGGAATCVAACSFVAWAAGASALGRLVAGARMLRAVNVTIAILLVASIALLWA